MKTTTSPYLTSIKQLFVSAACIVLAVAHAPRAFGTLIAYEGFDYPASTFVAVSNNLNGGIGWSSPWYDYTDTNGFQPTLANPGVSIIEAGSLTYTDSVGNALVTTGNKMLNTGTNNPGGDPILVGSSSRPWRLMASPQGAAGTTNWVSFIGVRGVGAYGTNIARGANVGFYNFRDYCWTNVIANVQPTNTANVVLGSDQNGRFGVGRSSGANVDGNMWWQVNSSGAASQAFRASNNVVSYPFTNVALLVLRIEHYNDGIAMLLDTNADNDTLYAWINPTNLNVEPDVASAFGVYSHTSPTLQGASPYFNDFAFDCVAFFAGNANASGANPPAEWYGDEIRVGTTYADVVPFIPPVGNVQPQIAKVQVVGNSISLTVTGAASTVYTILGASSITDPITNILGTASPTDGSGAGGTFTDVNALTSQSQRFYRARQ